MQQGNVFWSIASILTVFLILTDSKRWEIGSSKNGAGNQPSSPSSPEEPRSDGWLSRLVENDSFVIRMTMVSSVVFAFLFSDFRTGRLAYYAPFVVLLLLSTPLLFWRTAFEESSNASILMWFIWVNFCYKAFYGFHLTWMVPILFGPLLFCLWFATRRGWEK